MLGQTSILLLKQQLSGQITVTWPSDVIWSNGEEPTMQDVTISPGSIDNTFNTGSGFNGTVFTIAIQSDGKILVGGQFSTYNGNIANNIIRLNSDGSIDNTFNTGSGFNSYVNTLLIQSDGKILCGGSFTTYDGNTLNRIIRLNSDGTIDNTFNTGSGFDSTVNTISIQSDGKILVGGYFNNYDGNTASGIIRLNSNGTIDNTFNIGSGFNSPVLSITIQPDGKIICGGLFTSYSGNTSNYIIRLNSDGSIDNTFNSGSGFDSIVLTITIQSDGKILCGGDFGSYDVNTTNYIARLLGSVIEYNKVEFDYNGTYYIGSF